jgi:sialic acid synthase SpsE
VRIGRLDTDERVVVVAEIGNNHEGDASVAAELVDRAAEAGADGVKFQTFRTERFVSPEVGVERYERLRGFELAPEDFARLAERARAAGIAFLSTPLDLPSADVLEPLVDAFKVASGDNDFLALLDRVAASTKPVIVSSGASDLAGVRAAVDRLRAKGAAGVAVLHCVSAYPTPAHEANLAAIPGLAELGVVPGYSDHTVGVDAAPLAVSLGARIVEKHFTLDHAYSDFRDHALSADPGQLAELVRRVREAEAMLGDGEKRLQPSEQPSADAIRRSIAAARDLSAGEVLAPGDLTWLRPGTGLRPGREEELVGRRLTRDLEAGALIALTDVE